MIEQTKSFSNLVDYLEANFKEYYFGGTIPLYLYGVVTRSPHDIDIILPNDVFRKFKYVTIDRDDEIINPDYPQGETDDRVSLEIEGFVVDFITVSSEYQKKFIDSKMKTALTGTFLYDGRELPFIHPETAIEAKIRYVQNVTESLSKNGTLSDKLFSSYIKHSTDINFYNSMMKRIQIHQDLTDYLTF